MLIFVQSTSAAIGGSPLVNAFPSPNVAGHCLVAAVGVTNSGSFNDPTISDSQGNTWVRLLNAPKLFPSGLAVSCAYVFVAYNCKAGANTVTIVGSSLAAHSVCLLEYSGVAKIGRAHV